MAKQTGLFPFTGKIGNVVGYADGKKYFMRSAPAKVSQTMRTKKAASDFGIASGGGRLIRHALRGALDILYDTTVTNQLNKTFITALHADSSQQPGKKRLQPAHLQVLKGFSFNSETRSGSILLADPVVDRNETGSIRVSLPALKKGVNLHCSRKVTHIGLKAIAVFINFGKGQATQSVSESLIINVKKGAPAAELLIPQQSREATMVILEVQSFMEENGRLYSMHDRKCFAADVLAVFMPIPELETCVLTRSSAKPRLKKIPAPAGKRRMRISALQSGSPAAG